MCRLFAISYKEKKNIKAMVNALLVHYGTTNTDGTGFAAIENNKIVVRKSMEPAINFVLNNHYVLNTASIIAHVRTATTGKVSDKNAHPFISENRKTALVHNGMLGNYTKLRKKLSKKHKIKTNVDSELLLHAFEDKKEKFIEYANENETSGFANVAVLEKDGTIFVYSDGNVWYKEDKAGVIVLQDELFDGMKELLCGKLMTLKEGKILKIEDAGRLATAAIIPKWHGSNLNVSGINYAQEQSNSYIKYEEADVEYEISNLLEKTFEIAYSSIYVKKSGVYADIYLSHLREDKAKVIQMVIPQVVIEKRNFDEFVNVRILIKPKKLKRRINYWQNMITLPDAQEETEWDADVN